jgi:hypothetical protein
MPNLYLTMKREVGWNTETFYKKLLEKAQLEKIKVENSDYVLVWDSRPLIKDNPDELQLTWRYKRFKKS